MSAEGDLFEAYSEWHRLAKAGNKAIHKRDWGFVLECQSVTRKIQPSIARLTRQARGEWSRKADAAAKEKRLGAIIAELMKQLESNKNLLRTARSTALCKRDMLEQAGRNLKRLQSSYAAARPSAWTSFS
jgi:hypothetical protein